MNVHTAARQAQRASQQTLRWYQYSPIRFAHVSCRPQRNLHVQQRLPTLLRPCFSKGNSQKQQFRCVSSTANEKPLTDVQDSAERRNPSTEEIAARKAEEPAYQMTFTCRRCTTRSSHRITKQAYHFGTTLITCPGCKNRHLISDNLKIFSDNSMTLEDILKEKGEYLKKGRLGEDGDIEFYDDTTADKV